MANAESLILSKNGAVATLWIDRPDKRNAIDFAMWSAVPGLVERVENDDEIRVLVVRGGGDEAFSAGADIGEFGTHRADREAATRYDQATDAAERSLRDLSKPTIAMIHGFCIGGGAEIALACDLRFADTRCRFGVTPARLGLVYGLAATKQLCDLVGPAATKWLLFSGEHLASHRAHQVGLVDELHEPDRLEARTYAFARRIASSSQGSVRASKRIVARIAAGQIEDDAETRALREAALDGEDVQEGVRAFLEKRPPEFG